MKNESEKLKYPLYRNSDRRYIHYNPLTGSVNVPTYMNGKYLGFKYNWKQIKVHLFAFYYMTGEWSREQIDHIDENKLNNKWDNLQPLSGSNNQLKSSTKRQSNTSGYIGVSYHINNKNWLWHLQLDYKAKRGYGYKCPTSAAVARDKYVLNNKIPHVYLNILSR